MLTITQVKKLLADYDLRPNKRLGQNFLIDGNIVKKIKEFASIDKGDTIIEIGAGLGNITVDLADIAERVIAVEFDKGLCRALRDNLSGYKNAEVVCQDVLKFVFPVCARGKKIKIVGNLPYYITTPIIERMIENRDRVDTALFMVQKEVAERMFSKPGSRSYSSLTCYLGYFTRIDLRAVVKRTSFFPRPEVDSALIRVEFLKEPPVYVANESLFFRIIRAAFNQRRKTLLSSLSRAEITGVDKNRLKEILKRSVSSPDRRPETLSLDEFAKIANELSG